MIVKIEEIDGESVLVLTDEMMKKFGLKIDQKFKIVYENGSLFIIPEPDVTRQSD